MRNTMAREPQGAPRGEGRPEAAVPDTDDIPHSPIRVRDVADVRIGPAFRRGALADDRTEQVGGVVVMRFGANPRDVIAGIRDVSDRRNVEAEQ